MTTHGGIAARVRERKERYPGLYCAHPACLWSKSSGPCPKHSSAGSPAPMKGER